ncbi:Kinesin related motor protein [Spraguea lophii 42_110]|uniref:Kinesin related motor protein n=1 Tax=Spraguea lophii (strain 42_110) TaxID=1358809 RepID=S7W4U4_SPRLO|nr:Kinesin related motor protein [Spraguea lophii 42_110]
MDGKVNVFIRLRNNTNDKVWHAEDNVLSKYIDNQKISYPCFKKIFVMENTFEIYEEVVKSFLLELMDGKNCTVFTYGQTGSGKTYTMSGDGETEGIIFYSLETIFENINEDVEIHISYIEIYNENLLDLIDMGKKLKILAVNDIPVVNNLTKIKISSLEEALKIYKECETNKKIGETKFNKKSSRSHTIFQIEVSKNNTKSILNLIDLAGSERASGSSIRMREGAYINKSLLALGSVINSLKNNRHANFRDSKLTRILQPSMNSSVNLVSLCMISPTKQCINETISTLNFASRLLQIKMKGVEEKSNRGLLSNNVKKCNCDKKKIDFYNIQDSEIYRENTLLKRRIQSLENMISSLLKTSNCKRTKDIYLLEKNVFNLQLEMVKKQQNKEKEL